MNNIPNISLIKNNDGPTLGVCGDGFQIIETDGLKFKNHSRSGRLEPFEDWRLPSKERAEDLAKRLSDDELLALMMHSGVQTVPGSDGPFTKATKNGVPFAESGAEPWELTDQEVEWFKGNRLRHMLLGPVDTVENGAKFVNGIQALCESMPFAIPCNISTDPRHATDNSQVFNMGAGSHVSSWPEMIGIAATFDPALVREYGQVVSAEYRALGIQTALSPQIDLATDPRWGRGAGTFGPSPKLSAALAKALCEGMQTTHEGERTENGWGTDSIVAMVKHWPGGGTGEGGRDAHFAFGKYAVYPGGNFEDHLRPFTEGAFALDGGTESAAAVMPYYTISFNQDVKHGENVGNAYSKYIITDLLREKYGYDGVVCTDWGITFDPNPRVDDFACTCWGVEELERAERFYKAIEAGIDQFGDVAEPEFLRKAYDLGVQRKGREAMRARIERSAVRILTIMFRLGLFENPYLDEKKSAAIVGCEEFRSKGIECQRKSAIMLKNKGCLPAKKGITVYIPKKYVDPRKGFEGEDIPGYWCDSFDHGLVSEFFTVTDDPELADIAIVKMTGPEPGHGYSRDDRDSGGNGYIPVSLQYGEYTADTAREVSISGGDPREPFTNRSYKGKTTKAQNPGELAMLMDARERMGDKPVIVLFEMGRPAVLSEVEPLCDAIIAHYGISGRVLLEAVSGMFEPSGLLPHQMPTSMEAVEAHAEDLPFDMECYVDSEGNIYDFGYGMNWSGVINDERTAMYR